MQFPDDESDDHNGGDGKEVDMKKEIIQAPPRRLFLKQAPSDPMYSLRKAPKTISGPRL